MIAGATQDITDGMQRAVQSIDSGAAREKLTRLADLSQWL
jgi:anthranilate phosphoribosyltransferase